MTVSSTAAFAGDNTKEVKEALRAKHIEVIFLKEMDYKEYVSFVAHLEAGPAGVAAYLEELAASILKEAGGAVATDTIRDLLLDKKENTVVGGKPVYVGIVSYNHWDEVRHPTIKKGHVTWTTEKLPLPNTHRFYLAIGKK
jgi:hypothetical protein